jgi:caffeoyl-CoA O-methyltransferase
VVARIHSDLARGGVLRLAPVRVTAEIEAYMESLLPARDSVLTRLESEIEHEDVPGIGPHVGQFLSLLLKLSGARDVLELGTAAGYSTIWLARGCAGRVVTLEMNPERAKTARGNLAEAGLAERVEVVEEDALAYLQRGGGSWDCVFNDLLNSFPDEDAVERCFKLSVAALRPGGMLLADNALGRGRVVTPDSRQPRNIDRYNHLVAAAPELESVIVPLRDGVSLARRINT